MELGRARTFVLVALVVVVLGGAAVWWLFLRDDAPPEAALETTDCAVTSGGPATPDGNWKVQAGENDFVGYRIKELFGGATIKRTAVGRTSEVTGTMVVTGTTATDVEIKGDLATLNSDQVARDTAIQTKGLQTDDFPDATFTSDGSITLPAAPAKGKAVKASVKGELELHGKTQPVTVPVDACWTGSTIRVSGSAPVVLADYGMEVIKTPIVKIDDEGSLEFELTFVPA